MPEPRPSADLPPPQPGRRPPPGSARRGLGYNDIELDRCRALLALHSVGRIAWTAADGPQLFPVSYHWIDGLVVFRTSPYGILSELVQRTAVVFEVDEIDEIDRVGWSVIVRGRAAGTAFPDRLGRPSPMIDTSPWGSGHRSLVIGVTPTEISGRYFGPMPDGGEGRAGRAAIPRPDADQADADDIGD